MTTPAGWSLPLPPTALRQPDGFTCGPTAVLVAQLLHDPARAAGVPAARVASEVQAWHRRLTGPRDVAGRWQVPWPRLLGTPPWAVARALSHCSGRPHRVRLLRWRSAAGAAAVLAAAARGPVPLFVGSRWLPRHVLLTVGVEPGTPALSVFDPGAGRLASLPAADLAAGRPAVGRWPRAWFAVLPR